MAKAKRKKQPFARRLRLAVGKNKGIPAANLVIPDGFEQYRQSGVPDHLLTKTSIGGQLWTECSIYFENMVEAAKAEGIVFANLGAYRSPKEVEALFLQRYSKKDEGRKPQVTRTWKGETWYLKPGMAPAASPERGSPHQWGVAIDLGSKVNGKIVPLTEKARVWLCKNAPAYGFTLQSLPFLDNGKPNPEHEWWHWQWSDPS